jgi:hypothetical protein
MTATNVRQKNVVAAFRENYKVFFELLNYFLEEQSSNKRISKKQYNLELDAAMRRIDEGKYLTQSEVEKFFRNEI